MDSETLEQVRSTLQGKKDALLGRNSEEGATGDLPSDPVDMAGNVSSQEVSLILGSLDRTELEEINQALQKIKSGTYGVCESCGRNVHPMRLQALPTARYCVTCQERQEVRPHQGHPPRRRIRADQLLDFDENAS